ncbi:hypothetical protein C4553_02355 [Candidatus Parcubacteria bacterium]|nr:MAG: hypothetical protein C4553_02355 [Candidatus Parcubacteria bacterium]
MYLKRLEISGFKSFPHKTELQFPTGVSVVVGPNGSGKSNIVDALRWVLGEQGMQKLRSKKGEDLIFNGSGSRARLSKAGVTLIFDNKDKRLPFEFEEVSVGRKVYRDGQNQYFINNSEVRLKDVAEVIAKARLGLKGYTIINQGMGDIILNSSPLERREIFEDALGLKEYQLKKKEALDKLNQTRLNLQNAKNLIDEIEPHLKFLKKQVAKIEKREEFLNKLEELEGVYFSSQYGNIIQQKNTLDNILKELEEGIKKTKSEFDGINLSIKAQEEEWKKTSNKDEEGVDIVRLETKQMEISKELGKIEGLIEAGLSVAREKLFNKDRLVGSLKEIKNFLDGFENRQEADLKEMILSVSQKIDNLLSDIQGEKNHSQDADLESKRRDLRQQLEEIQKQLESAKDNYRRSAGAEHERRQEFTRLHGELRSKEQEMSQLETKYHRLRLEKEQLLVKEGELKQFFGERFEGLLRVYNTSNKVSLDASPEGLRKDIERLRVRLEMTSEIDPETEKEHEKLNKRHIFLVQESSDLEKSISDLGQVVAELESKIEDIFTNAFDKISESFNHYFETLFNGGKASLNIITAKKKIKKSEEFEEEETETPEVGGIEVKVDLPGKKVRGLHMLSGGERALTSVALLLALVSTSPPPFMVLDEIDASLDESNSQRFGRILQELKKNTQFVIVTHNREVMKEADVLYGVTMEEEGVSKLISLQLVKAEQFAY